MLARYLLVSLMLVLGCSSGFECPRGVPCTGSCCGNRCVDTSSDVANCGACGNVCGSVNNMVAACMGGRCTLGRCNPGYLDCNFDRTDGCEVDTQSDSMNCGGCGKRCAAGAHQSVTCASGACVTACTGVFKHCSANPLDGCEVDPEADVNNCGGCGNVCPVNKPYCFQGTCTDRGCLMNGKPPPRPCDGGNDASVQGTAWVVCRADCKTAWLSHAQPGGGQLHSLDVCKILGYSGWSGWDTTGNSICGTREGFTSCMHLGSPSFSQSPDKPNWGSDPFGPVLNGTVQWQCTR